MVYLGDGEHPPADPMQGWVVYHTGSGGGTGGVVKKLRLADLLLHPNKRWHPVQANPYFLGIFRWKILSQELPQ